MFYQAEYNEYQRLFDMAERIDFVERPIDYENAHAEANAAYHKWHNLFYGIDVC